MALKMIGLASCCGKCPNYGYYSGGAHECTLVNQVVKDPSKIAPFCPPADFPSKLLADMDATIRGLRGSSDFAFPITLLTHVATKLKVPIHENGRGLTVSFQDGKTSREVYFGVDYITEIAVFPGFEIVFMAEGEKKFKLLPDTRPPRLCEAMKQPDGSKEELWQHHTLV